MGKANFSCSVGLQFGDTCFSDKYVPTDNSLIPFDENSADYRTIRYRTNMSVINNICVHHRAAYLSHFHRHHKSTKCTDPFECHGNTNKRKRGKREGTKKSNLEQADEIAKKTLPYNIYPGQHLCI